MKVLGIDPGFGRIGFGCVVREGSRLTALEYGVIETAPGPIPRRLVEIQTQMQDLLTKWEPDILVTEKLFFAANRTTALDVSKSLGVILVTAELAGLPWVEYSPPEVKLSVTGNGAAAKSQVQFMAAKLLGIPKIKGPDDSADALAIALTHCLRHRV